MRISKWAFLTLLGAQAVRAWGSAANTVGDLPVEFSRQLALVSWNPSTQTEVLVVGCNFITQSADFAFLVPTPATPQVTTVDGEVFTKLGNAVKDATSTSLPLSKPKLTPMLPDLAQADANDLANKYSLRSIKADEQPSVYHWLRENKFDVSYIIKAYSDRYIRHGWWLNCFRLEAADQNTAKSPALCFKFKTDHPIFPYYTPRSNLPTPDQQEGLDLYYLGLGKASGVLGDDGPWIEPSALFKADRLTIEVSNLINVPLKELPEDAYISYFSDKHFPVAKVDDLTFSESKVASLNHPILPWIAILAASGGMFLLAKRYLFRPVVDP
jgi:hypothetical protein